MDLFGIQVEIKALSNLEIMDLVKRLKIPNFLGCFMKNELSMKGPKHTESAIVNFESNEMRGSHWCAFQKVGDVKRYFDSYGGACSS